MYKYNKFVSEKQNLVKGKKITELIDSDKNKLGPVYDENGRIVGYRVKNGQGPTHISEDLKKNYGLDVDWQDIVSNEFNNKNYFSHIINLFDKDNQEYSKLNMNEGDYIDLSFLITPEENDGLTDELLEEEVEVTEEVPEAKGLDAITIYTINEDELDKIVDAFGDNSKSVFVTQNGKPTLRIPDWDSLTPFQKRIINWIRGRRNFESKLRPAPVITKTIENLKIYHDKKALLEKPGNVTGVIDGRVEYDEVIITSQQGEEIERRILHRSEGIKINYEQYRTKEVKSSRGGMSHFNHNTYWNEKYEYRKTSGYHDQ